MPLHIHNSWVKRFMTQYMILGIIIIYGADYADCCDGVSGGVGDKFMGLQISQRDLGDKLADVSAAHADCFQSESIFFKRHDGAGHVGHIGDAV